MVWLSHESLAPEKENIVNPPLVVQKHVYLLPLHIKLGLMKTFVKAMDQSGNGFLYLKERFSRISDTKIREEFL